MREPLTDELLNELLDADGIEDYTFAHDLSVPTLSEYLQQMLDEHGLRRIDVIHAASLNETFGYQVFTGARNAGRDKLLQLAFGMGLSLREANRLLQAGHANALYCKDRRDAIIIYCLVHGSTLAEVNDELYAFEERTIC